MTSSRNSSNRILQRARTCLRAGRTGGSDAAKAKKSGSQPRQPTSHVRNAKGRFVSMHRAKSRKLQTGRDSTTSEATPSNQSSESVKSTNNNNSLTAEDVLPSSARVHSKAVTSANPDDRKHARRRGTCPVSQPAAVRASKRIRSLRYTQQNFARDTPQTQPAWSPHDDITAQPEGRASHSDNVFEFVKTLDVSDASSLDDATVDDASASTIPHDSNRKLLASSNTKSFVARVRFQHTYFHL